MKRYLATFCLWPSLKKSKISVVFQAIGYARLFAIVLKSSDNDLHSEFDCFLSGNFPSPSGPIYLATSKFSGADVISD